MFDQARALIQRFKGDSYVHGLGVLPRAGALAAHLGRRAALVRDTSPDSTPLSTRSSKRFAQPGSKSQASYPAPPPMLRSKTCTG
jgi:hypothetical protein